MDNERLKKQMDFILEMDKMKSIMRFFCQNIVFIILTILTLT